jgi:hypothetical protein
MTYRPLIHNSVHERVQLYMIGKDGSPNQVYNNAAKMAIDEEGNRTDIYSMMYNADADQYEWYRRLKIYADENDKDLGDVLDNIVTTVMDEDGEPELQFKSSIGL